MLARGDRCDGASGSWAPPGWRPVERPQSRSRLALAHRPGAAQSELRIGCVAAARSTPDYVVLAVLNTALGGAFVSRINLKLREEKGFTYGARSAFDYRRQPGPFVVQASVQTDATAEAVQDVLDEIADIAGPRPITPLELTRAHAALTRGYPRNFETADQIARAVAQLALHGLPDDYFDRFVDGVRHVTADEVVDAAQRYLPLDVLRDGGRRRPRSRRRSLAALGLGEPEPFTPGFEPGDETRPARSMIGADRRTFSPGRSSKPCMIGAVRAPVLRTPRHPDRDMPCDSRASAFRCSARWRSWPRPWPARPSGCC